MARLTSDDRPAKKQVIEGLQDSIARESRVLDQPLADADQPLADADQPGSDRDQTAPDRGHPAGELDKGAIFDGCRERLQALLGDHADITVVERAIANYPLDDEERAALWLWAIAPFDPTTVHLGQLRDAT